MLGKDIYHDHLSQAIRAISTPILNKPNGDVSLAKLLGQILSLSKKFNIEATPTLIINDKKFDNPQNYKKLKKTIEKLI